MLCFFLVLLVRVCPVVILVLHVVIVGAGVGVSVNNLKKGWIVKLTRLIS